MKLESICAEVFSDYQMSVCDLFYLKNRDLSKSDHVCGSESCHEQRRLLRISEKELMLLIRLEKVTKPSLKSLDSTNPQSDRLCTNGGNSRPLLPSREVDNNKDHSKAERVIVWEVAKVPRVTSKQLNAFLISLMDGWNQNRIYWFKWEAIMFGEKNTLHSSLRILSHLWNMVVVVSWLGPVLLHLGQDGLPSLMEQWILNYTSKF